MTLYFVVTLLLTTLSAIVLADAEPPTPAIWGLLHPGLAWAVLRAGGRWPVAAPPGRDDAGPQPQPLAPLCAAQRPAGAAGPGGAHHQRQPGAAGRWASPSGATR